MGFSSLDPDRGLDKFAANFICTMARSLIGKYGYTKSDLHDIEQELACHLIAKFPKYDPAKARRTTFTADIVSRKLVSMLRHRRALCRKLDGGRTSLSDPMVDADDEISERSQTIDEATIRSHTGQDRRSEETLAELRMDLETMIPALPPKLREFCELLLRMPMDEVVKHLGISRPTAKRRISAILEYFRDADLDQYL